jgi:hypothetical protein
VTAPPTPIAWGTLKLPKYDWIPNIDQISESAGGLLAVIGAGLDQYGIGEPFKRRVFTHGEQVPLHRGDTAQAQLVITFINLELGEPGQKVFQLQKGAIGSHAHIVGNFKAQLWIPWPIPEGGLAPTLADDTELMEASIQLNRVGWVAFATLRALSLAGVVIDPPVTPIQQDGIIIGPVEPLGPQGGLAGVGITVQLLYS